MGATQWAASKGGSWKPRGLMDGSLFFTGHNILGAQRELERRNEGAYKTHLKNLTKSLS